jgi:hypothetical protein
MSIAFSVEGALFGSIFLVAVGTMLYRRWMNRRTLHWPTVEAVVRDHMLYRRAFFSWNELTYAYSIDGREYQGKITSFTDALDELPEGSLLVVHYKPNAPGKSYAHSEDIERAAWRSSGRTPPF